MAALISLLLIVAAVFIILGLAGFQGISLRRVALPKELAQPKGAKLHSFFAFLFPFTPFLLEKMRLDIRIKDKLDAAHSKFTAKEFFNLKLGLIIILVILGSLALAKYEPLVILVAAALGYIIPDIILNRKIAQRKYMIARLLPETVDLLGLCVEAGLDFTSAVKWIIEERISSNPLLDEMSFVLEEIKWGKPRIQALKDMSKRLNIPEVSSFVQTLVQAERMGTPVAEAFSILSEDSRLQRFHRGERFAMQAPIKILIPLIFCILPVIAIIIGGPIFLQFTQGGLFQGAGG